MGNNFPIILNHDVRGVRCVKGIRISQTQGIDYIRGQAWLIKVDSIVVERIDAQARKLRKVSFVGDVQAYIFDILDGLINR